MKLIMVTDVPDTCAPANLLSAIATSGDAFNEIGAKPDFDTDDAGKRLPLWRVLQELLDIMVEQQERREWGDPDNL